MNYGKRSRSEGEMRKRGEKKNETGREGRGKGARIGSRAFATMCNGMRARFGARGHTFNFAGPITKSDMHHSEINSQQRAHVLFVMSRRSELRAGNGRGGIARKMSAGMVAGSGYLSSELPVNDNPCSKASSPAYPMYITCLYHFASSQRPSFVISFTDFASPRITPPSFHPLAPLPTHLLPPTLLSKFA